MEMFFLGKLGKTLFISFLAFGLLLASIDAIYVEYKRAENVNNIEMLKLLPAGADMVRYFSEGFVDPAATLSVQMAKEGYLRHRNIKGEELLYRFMSWSTKDLKVFYAGFYKRDEDFTDDLYVLKHKKIVKKPEFISPENSQYVKKIGSYNGIDIYQIEIRRGLTYGIIYFTWVDKYVVHSSNPKLLKKSLDLIAGKDEKTAYDEFKHIIDRIPRKYWYGIVIEHFKDPRAKIPFVAAGKLYSYNIAEAYYFAKVIASDPRKLHGGILRGDIWDVWYILLKCTDEECVKNYTQVLYDQKCFDIKVEGRYIHAKKFDWDPDPEYDYIKGGMFPTMSGYLTLFLFVGYEWRGSPNNLYFLCSPEYPCKTEY